MGPEESQCYVLGPLLFIHFITQLSSLIFDSFVKLKHYRCSANDTQIFNTFSALDFKLKITHLKTTIENASTWMSANLSPNQSNAASLLIGLPKQLSTISDPTLLMPSDVTRAT